MSIQLLVMPLLLNFFVVIQVLMYRKIKYKIDKFRLILRKIMKMNSIFSKNNFSQKYGIQSEIVLVIYIIKLRGYLCHL